MGRKPTEEPKWFVFIDDFNGKKIKEFNVFHSYRFFNLCKAAFKKFKIPEQIKELEKEIKSCAKYSFWSKCEYEIVVSPLFQRENEGRKVDVYDQLLLNWDSFFKYTIDHKAFFLRRTQK